MQRSPRPVKLDLGLPFLVAVLGKGIVNRPTEGLFPRPVVDGFGQKTGEIVIEDGLRALIDRAQNELLVENQDPGRQIGQNRLQISPRRFDLGAMPLGFPPGVVELPRHAVERLGQDTQLIPAVDSLARSKVAGSHRLRAFCKNRQRRRKAARQHKSQGNRSKQRKQNGQGQGHRINARQTFAPE